jgi:hypothetical protein
METALQALVALGVLALTAGFVVATSLLGHDPRPVEPPEDDDDLLTWLALHPDRVHAPDTLAEENL